MAIDGSSEIGGAAGQAMTGRLTVDFLHLLAGAEARRHARRALAMANGKAQVKLVLVRRRWRMILERATTDRLLRPGDGTAACIPRRLTQERKDFATEFGEWRRFNASPYTTAFSPDGQPCIHRLARQQYEPVQPGDW
jgi:hypothetical protein